MRFNLIDEPWLPCVATDGRPVTLGLRDALLRAHRLRELRDGSPLVTAALHRLMQAVLHRVFGPADAAGWQELWDADTLPAGPLNAYHSRWHRRFDLLDEERPFYQTAGFATNSPSGVNRLAQELARGNNATLFDHTDDTDPPALSPSDAARIVVAEQSFAVGGGKSATGNTTHAPLVGGVAVFPQGPTLRETLLLNLVTYDGDEKPFPTHNDVPFWERDRAAEPPLEMMSGEPCGLLDLLTWQTRTLRLHAEESGGQTVIRRVSYAQGRRFAPRPGFREPAFAIFRDLKNGDRPIRFSEHRAIWRDSSALCRFTGNDEFRGPLTLEELADRRVDAPDLPRVCLTAVFGICTNKAKVNFWRHERLPLPLAYLADKELVGDLKTALDLAEETADVLRSAVRVAARSALSPADPSKADKDRTSQLVEALAPERLYWSRLEEPFRRVLVGLPGGPAHRLVQLRDWFDRTLKRTAMDAFNRTVGELDSSARAHRAAVEGEVEFYKGLAKLRTTNAFRHVFPLQSITKEPADAVV